MPLTTYSSGQVLTAASLNSNLDIAGGLQLITAATFTTQTSISLPNDTFTADYTNYRFLLNLSAVTADATLTMRMRTSGTDNTGSNYELAGTETNSTNTTVTGITSAGGLTSWSMAESDPIDRYALTVDVMAPQIAEPTLIFGNLTYVNTAATAWRYRNFAGCFTAGTVFDSLSYISSVASSLTGSYSVYGYNK